MAKSESEKDMRQKNENLNKTVQEQDVAERNQAYNEYVKQVTPTHNLALKMLKAFVTGGIICCIGQVILNIAVVTNTIPNTGITLPFISYGGTSVVFLLLEMGLVLSVSSLVK